MIEYSMIKYLAIYTTHYGFISHLEFVFEKSNIMTHGCEWMFDDEFQYRFCFGKFYIFTHQNFTIYSTLDIILSGKDMKMACWLFTKVRYFVDYKGLNICEVLMWFGRNSFFFFLL
jgi:hypothetical protein